jgi:hypothetical protein
MVSEITANGTTYSLGSEMTDLIDLLGMCYSDVEPMADLSKSELKSLRRWLKVHALAELAPNSGYCLEADDDVEPVVIAVIGKDSKGRAVVVDEGLDGPKAVQKAMKKCILDKQRLDVTPYAKQTPHQQRPSDKLPQEIKPDGERFTLGRSPRELGDLLVDHYRGVRKLKKSELNAIRNWLFLHTQWFEPGGKMLFGIRKKSGRVKKICLLYKTMKGEAIVWDTWRSKKLLKHPEIAETLAASKIFRARRELESDAN